ncbi:hypothetical protein [Streptosporangium sp. NPDC000396]
MSTPLEIARKVADAVLRVRADRLAVPFPLLLTRRGRAAGGW